jgi:hypothetical protein
MKITKLLFLSIAICMTSSLFGQTQKLLPVMAPPSPEAASFSKYGNYQVNLFTGIPDISIPLYEIKIGDLSVPITLNYHSSGIKVSDIASRVGLGWDLQAGGSITRKIKGMADEISGNYFSATPTSMDRVKTVAEIATNTDEGLDYLNSVDVGVYDVEPDIFSYSFPGHGGKFLFNQKNNYAPLLIPYAPVSINMSTSLNNLSLGMTDESGINYRFDSTEWTTSGGGITTSCTSAWLLSDMISANKQDSVHFRYSVNPTTGNTDSYTSDYLVIDDRCSGSYFGNTTGTFHSNQGYVTTNWRKLNQIDYKNGKVVFESDIQSRQEPYNLQKRLNIIKIYNYDPVRNIYKLIKSISFYQSYFTSAIDASKRLRLDSLQINTLTGLYKLIDLTTIPV